MVNFYFIKGIVKKSKTIFIFIIFSLVSNVSYSDVYRVENVFIQERINSSKNFRQNLINKGIVSSFEILAKRILAESEYWKIKNIESSLIKEMVSQVSIMSEQKIINNYKITLSILFDSHKVKNSFTKRNITYSDSISQPILVFPIIKENNQHTIWENNFFSKNWELSTYKNYLSVFLHPEGDLWDRENFNLKYFNLKENNESIILKKYGLNNSLVLFVDFDSSDVKYKLSLSGSEYYKSMNKKIPKTNREIFFLEVINEIKRTVENRWKYKNVISSGSILSIEFITKLKDLNSLSNLRKNLRLIDSIKNLKNLEVKGKIYFVGSIEDLKIKMADNDIILKEDLESWKITVNE